MSKRNENRPGYKKTKVGWIPEDWECLTIKEVCSQPVSGFSAKGNAEAVSPNDSNIGVLRLSCIIEGYFNSYENKKVVQADIPKVKTPISKDTMLISRSNTEELVGVVCYVEKDYPNLFLSDLIWQVSAKSSEILSIRWLTNLLLTKEYRRKIAARANGTSGSMKKITKGGFLTLPIPLPPLPEQKKIAEILSAWDRSIEQVGKLIDAKQRLKKGLMQQLLTGWLRFPEFNHETHERHEKDKGELPVGWRKLKLGEICNPQQWPTIPTKSFLDSGYPVYGANGIIGYYHTYNHEQETIAVTCRGATCGEVNLAPEKSYITGNAMSLDDINDKEVNQMFLFYILKHRGFRDIISGSAQPQIIRNNIAKIRITLPVLPEQTRIAAVLSTCDKEIELLKKKQEKLKEQKKGLMQKLLTGEVRHPEFLKEGHS
ncbi:MAG: restriction endonuclease subunit S [Deltaproteobacteria bacterium]|nr:restriction endonuclease subunit S [Deltaproteobacteria bacterium]MBW1966276.1 restriction endonuclease subunit S [Deltaproteobacteria bacterium]MBW2098072.1 restriction endonuclease subunit S [Deltaproteobacteria bacterium]